METKSTTNTILLVIILAVIVGGIVWFVTSRYEREKADNQPKSLIEVNIPDKK